jgi:hypothetical protein
MLREAGYIARWTVQFTKAKPREDGSMPPVDLAIPLFGYQDARSIAVSASFPFVTTIHSIVVGMGRLDAFAAMIRQNGGSALTGGALEFAAAYDVLRALLADFDPADCSGPSETAEHLLRQCCKEERDGIVRALPEEAEYHGVVPLLEASIGALADKAIIPDDVRRLFVALASRQRHAAAAREKCIDELLAAFAIAEIPNILLKGAALAHRIYASPALRPMVDIDVLVRHVDIGRAVRAASRLGYSFALGHGSRFAGRVHHLPIATKVKSGFCISLELHLDAMSRDVRDSLTHGTMTAAPIPFRRGAGPQGLSFGHVDMLRHLTRHTFLPSRRIRLIHLYDLWRYQAVFRDEIDWRTLAASFPGVMIALQLVAYAFPGPVSGRRTLDRAAVPPGVGMGMVALSEIAAAKEGFFAKLSELFNPPAWWVHGFYGVAPGQSLLFCRTVHHPLTVVRWLAMRAASAIGISRPHRIVGIVGEG